jgi:hypothetical protein
MIKIKYPTDADRLDAFHTAYFDSVSRKIADHSTINPILASINTADGIPLDVKGLLLAPFCQLADLSDQMAAFSETNEANLINLTKYEELQPTISDFFMQQQDLSLSTCYYCNVDSIYVFSKYGDYTDPLDFANRAIPAQLKLIKGMRSDSVENIIKKRMLKRFNTLADCPVSTNIREEIKKRKYDPTHNHFTLDHFYHKARHKFLSLCLYNLIPTCYACNSKFKGTSEIYGFSPAISSPSSPDFSFDKDVVFKVYLKVNKNDVKTVDHFTLDLVAERNPELHANFLQVLNLQGRYLHFKRVALRLMLRQIEYPESELQVLSDSIGKSIPELKRHLFGAELYDAEYDGDTLIKFKRDIARNIELLDV